jgi:PAS domain S-box-containing protein
MTPPAMPLHEAPRAGAAGGVDGGVRLPIRTTDFDAGVAALLHAAVGGTPGTEILTACCQQLARLLRAPLVLLARRLETGATALEATSGETALWLALQRVPERWDSGLASAGPAGECLRRGHALRQPVSGAGFDLWRDAAAADAVVEVLALPVPAADGMRVLEVFLPAPLAPGATSGTLSVDTLVSKVRQLFADLRAIEGHALVARALACAGNGAFITDLEGTIVWSNAAFSALSGHAPGEVLGQNPRMLRSGEQGVRYYRELWGALRAGRSWSGETVDRARDGSTYTIHQTVSPVSREGQITHYVSIHQDIGRQRRAQARLELASQRDPATGLLTRAAFEAAAEQALAAGPEACTFVVVSLRGVQGLARTLPDEVLDAASAAAGERLRAALGGGELAGLYGPFEYALLLGAASGAAPLADRLAAIAQRLERPIAGLAPGLAVDAHFGAAHFPGDGTDLRALRRRADRALADQPYRRARRRVDGD